MNGLMRFPLSLPIQLAISQQENETRAPVLEAMDTTDVAEKERRKRERRERSEEETQHPTKTRVVRKKAKNSEWEER